MEDKITRLADRYTGQLLIQKVAALILAEVQENAYDFLSDALPLSLEIESPEMGQEVLEVCVAQIARLTEIQ